MKEDIEIQCKKKTDYYQDSGTKGCVRCEYYDDSNKYPQLITINNSKNIIKIPNISECLLDNYQERMLKSLNHLIKLSKEKYEDDTF